MKLFIVLLWLLPLQLFACELSRSANQNDCNDYLWAITHGIDDTVLKGVSFDQRSDFNTVFPKNAYRDKVLSELIAAKPEGVYYVSIAYFPGQGSLTLDILVRGSNALISRNMRNLDVSPSFKNPSLQYVSYESSLDATRATMTVDLSL